jgi:hypothetical protein
MWSTLLVSVAFGGNAAVSAGGGFDAATEQPWAGLDLALFPSQDHGFAAFGRVNGGYGFADGPLGALELGGAFVIPNEEAVVRLGLAGRIAGIYTDYRAPIPVGAAPSDGDPAPGLLPGGMLVVEFEWGDEAPFTLRGAGGVGSTAAAVPCDGLDVFYQCIGWRPGFLGGISARGRLKNGLFLEALGGPSLQALVGYGFPTRRRTER